MAKRVASSKTDVELRRWCIEAALRCPPGLLDEPAVTSSTYVVYAGVGGAGYASQRNPKLVDAAEKILKWVKG